jgi:hypothetical protein
MSWTPVIIDFESEADMLEEFDDQLDNGIFFMEKNQNRVRLHVLTRSRNPLVKTDQFVLSGIPLKVYRPNAAPPFLKIEN